MGDMVELYRERHEYKKLEKESLRKRNFKIINEWIDKNKLENINIEYRAHSILFRCPDKPKADFFPTTNKWRSKNKTFYGDANKFLAWYDKE